MNDISMLELLGTLIDNNRSYLENAEVCRYEISVGSDINGTKPLIGLFNLRSREIITEPNFTYLGKFFDGVAACEAYGKWGYIKSDATYLLEPVEYVEALDPVDGIGRIKNSKGQWFLFDCVSGRLLSDESYDEIEIVGKNEADIGMALFKVTRKIKVFSNNRLYDSRVFALIRRDGIKVTTFECEDFYFIEKNMLVVKKGAKYCLLDIATNRALVNNAFEISLARKGWYISTYYDDTGKVRYRLTSKEFDIKGGYVSYNRITEGIIACEKNNYGVDIYCIASKRFIRDVDSYQFNESGEIQYLQIWRNNKIGVVSVDGGVILEPIATYISGFEQYMLKVCKDGEHYGIWSLKTGEWLVDPYYYIIILSSNGIFKVANLECLSSCSDQKQLLWSCVKGRNVITKEYFRDIGIFSNGCADAISIKGICGKLYENGVFVEG